MATGKPLIAILMAVYEPRLDWLEEQLKSLNEQTYPNLRLYIRDDCSPAVPFEKIEGCVAQCIRSFPYELKRNVENLGSNATFERLTQEAEGDFFAYCDQDDVWLPKKLATLQEAMDESGAQLVCSDMYIIDAQSRQTADSITKVRRHHKFRSGQDLAPDLLVSNFVTGCTMMIRAETAKAAVPFCPHMVHDHYLALYAATKGELLSLPQPLIRYRIHGGNQTGLLAGVTDKESYGKVRIHAMLERLLWLQANLRCDGKTKQAIDSAVLWAQARESNWEGRGGKRTIWKYRSFSVFASLFEVFGNRLPEPIFQVFITLGKRNIL